MILNLTQDSFKKEVLECDTTVLVDFYATWCTPCKMIAPHVEQLAEEFPALKVCRMDVDAAGAIALQYGVRSIPTLLFFRGGEVLETAVGYREMDELRELAEATV